MLHILTSYDLKDLYCSMSIERICCCLTDRQLAQEQAAASTAVGGVVAVIGAVVVC